MKNLSVLLVILSLLFLVIPIIQQMIKVKQENKLALVADMIPEIDESISEYSNADTQDLDVYSYKKIEFYLTDFEKFNDSSKNVINPYRQKLESPPPQS